MTQIREFFSQRNVLEVETPLLCSSGVTDPSLEPFLVGEGAVVSAPRYLQTSPEYAMKRLLAAGSGPIYQISRAFRDGEVGARHNPEFSILEWYRPEFSHHELMAEVAELVCSCLGLQVVEKISYRDLFLEQLDLDPFNASIVELRTCAQAHIDTGNLAGSTDMWLELLMSHIIEPQLSQRGVLFVYDYPASQAALSRIVKFGDVDLGQRFELYVNGMELANGYCELIDGKEQQARFENDNVQRRDKGLAEHALDPLLMAAMDHGLPSCSGVALGIDRLLMLVCGVSNIGDVLAFDWVRS